MTVAKWAGQPKVVLYGFSTGCQGDDMLNVQRHSCDFLRSKTVPTAITGFFGYLFA
jgi:hypothetical protein